MWWRVVQIIIGDGKFFYTPAKRDRHICKIRNFLESMRIYSRETPCCYSHASPGKWWWRMKMAVLRQDQFDISRHSKLDLNKKKKSTKTFVYTQDIFTHVRFKDIYIYICKRIKRSILFIYIYIFNNEETKKTNCRIIIERMLNYRYKWIDLKFKKYDWYNNWHRNKRAYNYRIWIREKRNFMCVFSTMGKSRKCKN